MPARRAGGGWGGGRLTLALVAAAGLMITQCAAPRPEARAGEAAKAPLPTPGLLDAERAGEQRLYSAFALERFLAALERLEKGRRRTPLRIVQIGDSHTANDAFSGRMRALLQDRFGAAGRGWLPAGIPFAYYRPRLVSVSEAGWRQRGATDSGREFPLGLDAAAAESAHPGAWMKLASTEPEGFDRLALEFVARPKGGRFSLKIDDRPSVVVSTTARRSRAKRVAVTIGGVAHEVTLAAMDAQPVALLGWDTERRRPGVVYENHGTIGATAALLGRIDAATVARELAASRPALIVVAFGTNEGFEEALDPVGYERLFRDRVAALQRAAPRAAILVLGPPDGNRRDPACPTAGGADRCGAEAPPCAWHEPPNLAIVRRIQKRVAARRGWAFWDWSAAMGGACSMDRLYRRDPPLAFADHVHLNGAGYAASADVLFFDLIGAYQRWKETPAGRRLAGP